MISKKNANTLFLTQVGIKNICKRGNLDDITYLLENSWDVRTFFEIICEESSLDVVIKTEELVSKKLDYFEFLLMLNEITEKATQKKNYKLCSHFFEKYNLNIANFIY